jgi:hypothetical protein
MFRRNIRVIPKKFQVQLKNIFYILQDGIQLESRKNRCL